MHGQGGTAIEGSPLIHMLSEGIRKVGHPEDSFEDELEATESQIISDRETGLTEFHILTNLFGKKGIYLEYLKLREKRKAVGTRPWVK